MKIIRNLFIAGLLLTVTAFGAQSASAHENSSLNEIETASAPIASEDFVDFLQWSLSGLTFGLYEGEKQSGQRRGIKAPPTRQ